MNNSHQASFTEKRKWYALGILMIVGLFNYIDRLSISILQVPIKAELNLSDTQIGILTGLAFSLIYTTMSIPIARLADKMPRKIIIACTLLIWSLMTAACGLASSFIMLVLLRMGVAIGEAGCVPATHSMLSDYFPFSQRATAIATYGLVFPLGTLLGFGVSGWLSAAFGWRITFIVLGLVGASIAPLILFALKEPSRGATDDAAQDTGSSPDYSSRQNPSTMLQSLSMLWRSPAFRYLVLGGAILSYPLNVALVWNPAFYDRSFGVPISELAFYLALLSGGAGAFGLYLSGFLADRIGHKDPRWYMWIPGGAGLLLVPAMFCQYLLSGSAYTSFLFGIITSIMMNAFLAPMNAIAQALAGPYQRALASASIVFSAGLIGTVFGPLFTGIISDLLSTYFDTGQNSLRFAILSSTPVALLGSYLLLRGARYLPNELK